MLDIQQKRKIRSIMYHRATLGVLAVIVLVSIHSTWVVYAKQRESENLKIVAQKQAVELQQSNSDLEKKIEALQTAQGIEAEIRNKFSVAKADENVVVIVDDQATATATTTKTSFWQRVKGLFVRK